MSKLKRVLALVALLCCEQHAVAALGARNQLLYAESAAGVGTDPYSPAAFTPTANTTVACFVLAHAASNNPLRGDDITLSDTQGYFSTTAVAATTGATGWGYGAAAFVGTAGASPASTTLTLDAGAESVRKYRVYCAEWTGAEATVGQAKATSSATNTGAQTLTLDASPASTSDVIAAILHVQDNAGATSPGSGWTELQETSESGWANTQIQGRTGSTSTTVDWTAGGTGSYGSSLIAVEIAEAGGGGGGSILPHVLQQASIEPANDDEFDRRMVANLGVLK